MGIVCEIWIWRDDDRLYSRLTTNVCAKRLLNRLTALGLLESIETIHAYFGDRADGGSGYQVAWKESVDWDYLHQALPKL